MYILILILVSNLGVCTFLSIYKDLTKKAKSYEDRYTKKRRAFTNRGKNK